MAKNISAMPHVCNISICSPRINLAQITATGSSTVIKIELRHAPIFGMPSENNAVGIVVPNTANPIPHGKKDALKLKLPAI